MQSGVWSHWAEGVTAQSPVRAMAGVLRVRQHTHTHARTHAHTAKGVRSGKDGAHTNAVRGEQIGGHRLPRARALCGVLTLTRAKTVTHICFLHRNSDSDSIYKGELSIAVAKKDNRTCKSSLPQAVSLFP
jgi:hypothetical protein